MKNMHLAQAHWFASKDFFANDKYGDEIAHLRKALSLVNSSAQFALASPVRKSFDDLRDMITERLKQAERDNNLVYHYVEPAQNELGALESMVRAKEVPWEPTGVSVCGNAFDNLITPEVKAAADRCVCSLHGIPTHLPPLITVEI